MTILAKKVIYGFALVFLLFLCVTTVIYRSDGYEVSVNSWVVVIRIGIAIGGLFLLHFIACLIEKCPAAVSAQTYQDLLVHFDGTLSALLFLCE